MIHIKSNDLFEAQKTESIYQRFNRPIVIADHLLTPENMGALIRLSDNIGASEVCFLGTVPGNALYRTKRIAASSKDNIKWYFTEENNLRNIVPPSKKIIAIETSDTASNIFTTELPDDVAFVVGNERYGMKQDILNQADMTVYIPVPGQTRSLNVSHAAAFVFFEWLRQISLR